VADVRLGAALMVVPGPGALAATGLMILGLAAASVFPLLTLTTGTTRLVGLPVAASAVGGPRSRLAWGWPCAPPARGSWPRRSSSSAWLLRASTCFETPGHVDVRHDVQQVVNFSRTVERQFELVYRMFET
jgi:hypothetical protein